MLLAAGILASIGSTLILVGAAMQAIRALGEVVGGPTRHGVVEHDDGELGGTRLQKWWYKSRWFRSEWRDASLLDTVVFRSWMLIVFGSALVLSGSIITALAA